VISSSELSLSYSVPMPVPSRFDHLGVVDPAGVAKRLGADGYGVVWAVVGSGIHGAHPHFVRYENLALPPPLRHRDFTVAFAAAEDQPITSTMDDAALSDEALFDGQRHGTHVAGLIAGWSNVADKNIDWDIEQSLAGIAPRCKLVSLKVIDDDGKGDERSVLAALQYVDSMNQAAGHPIVNGVVIALSLAWDRTNFPCGGSPVCEAVHALIDSGVVVVAPAGNHGEKGPSTILDPGNAERAITVGSTHRVFADRYGASYFSSRGPTADGRLKPDLLAPGERILSAMPPEGRDRSRPAKRKRKAAEPPRPAGSYQTLDGTSIAAAQVAGAIAAILSVRSDLIGHPDGVKKLLLESATDLGRDRYFQGHGFLNLSRALDEHVRIERETVPVPKVSDIVASPSPTVIQQTGTPETARAEAGGNTRRFAVAFSFAGEQNDYVERVWKALRLYGRLPRRRIFYHKVLEGELSRPNLDVYLQDIYLNQTDLLVVFLSAEYATKEWTGLEWRVVREMIKQKKSSAVMPIRFDETDIPGLFSIDGYVSAAGREPEDVADDILDRLESMSLGRTSTAATT
jgi:Subtilase family/TIR domain